MSNEDQHIDRGGWKFDYDQDWNVLGISRTVSEEVYHYNNQADQSASGESLPEENPASTPSDQSNNTLEENRIGNTSDYWKNAASCLVMGSVTFLLTVVAVFAFSMTHANAFLFLVAGLTLLYGAFRFGFSYYIYKDAKIVGFHSRKQRDKPETHTRHGWTPSPFLWAFATFSMPPFVEYGPAAVYYIRRHQRTGVP